MDIEKGQLFIGVEVGEAKEPFIFDSADFTTHGVIVGMTGSGKSGLAVTILEEALLSGIPCFILDPKGDMGNLLLNFPDLAPSDFRPWVDVAEAERQGISPDQLAANTAASWKEGLAGAGITPERMRQLRDGTDMTIYTPGSGAGVGLNVLGSMKAPTLDWESQSELIQDEIEAFVIAPGQVVVMHRNVWHDACRGATRATPYYWMAICGLGESPWIPVAGGPRPIEVKSETMA